jgi:integrase
MQSVALLDSAGRRRSPATLPSFHQGRPPRNKGLSYPPDPPTVEEIITVMRAAGDTPDGLRLRALIVVLWRAGLRISEALALTESDLDRDRGAILVRRGKGGKRREVGMDRWAWEQLGPWLTSSSVTHTLLKCPMKASRSLSFNASSVTPTLRSPPPIYAGSTAPRSCTRSTNDPHQ